MLIFIDEILKCFESCFSRKAAFHWFVTIKMGLMLRSDQLGVTSVIRVLALKRLNELNASGLARMDLVTKAKKSCIAYVLPPARKPGRGRPAIKGSSVKLKELFHYSFRTV